MGMISIPVTRDTKRRRRREEEEGEEADHTTRCARVCLGLGREMS